MGTLQLPLNDARRQIFRLIALFFSCGTYSTAAKKCLAIQKIRFAVHSFRIAQSALINQPVLCRICPRPPRLKRRALLLPQGIFQTAVGSASWESHPDVVLTKPPPLRCLWLGGSIIIPLHISWRIGCHTDFWSCSCSLEL